MTRREFSKATKLAEWQSSGGLCRHCKAKLFPGNIEYHHRTECTFAGSAGLDNCVALCRACHSVVTSGRAAVIAKSNRVRNKHIGIRKRPSFRGWRRFNGTAVFANKEP